MPVSRTKFGPVIALAFAGAVACGESATEPGPVEGPDVLMSLNASSGTTVFINEIHYDNAGTDAGEAIEVAGPAGTDLSGWSLVLYNGANGLLYDTQPLSGTLADVCAGYGFLAISYPVNGIQNGSPDGIALVDASSNVVQFLSYEGAFTALDGPANGIASTNIGVSEGSATPIGNSLQLSGIGLEYEDFAWSPDAPATFGTCNTGQTFGTPATNVIINELDADNPSIDALEFVELFDGGAGNTALDGLVVVFFTGSSDASYAAFDLDGYSTDADGYFVLGNAGVANVDLVFPGNTLQNGADAVGLYVGNAAGFPYGTSVTTTKLLDAIVYDTNDADDAGLLVLLNSGQPQVNEDAAGDKDNHSNQRIPNGSGGARNTDSYVQIPPTPGAINVAPAVATHVVVNELDADNPGIDALEFVELFDGGTGNTSLWGLVVVFFNGATDESYRAFDLDAYSTDADGYFVLGNAGVANVDLVFPGNTLQNGADAVGLFVGNAVDFPFGTAVTTTDLVDAIVYDTDDADDAGLLVLLNSGQPQVNEAGGGDKNNHSNQRIPNGAGGARNTDTYAQILPTPGAVNTANPSIDIEKATDGHDADVTPGPSLHVGSPVAWTYVVTNDGDVLLSNVTVTDDQGVAVSCPQSTLVAGESMTCSGAGVAMWGPYANLGTATGTPPALLPDVSDSDPSHYLGILDVAIDIRPSTDLNDVNLGARGLLPVAILTTADFDAATADPASITLGDDDGNDTAVATRQNGRLFASLKDVDDDGDMDLIVHFDIQALVANGDLTMATMELVLNGLTTVGLPIQGVDSVIIVP